MEDIDRTIKKALGFICVVQNSCDTHRQFLEQLFKDEFLNFVDKRKRTAFEEQEKTRIENEKHDSEDLRNVKEKLNEMEIAELNQADALLRKARLLREKFEVQFLKNNGEDSRIRNETRQATEHRPNFGSCTARLNEMSLSKSEPQLKSPMLNPRHNQSSIKRSQTLCSERQEGKRSVHHLPTSRRKPSTDAAVSVISKKELHVYKGLVTNPIKNCVNAKLKYPHPVSKKTENGGNKTWKRPVAIKSEKVSVHDTQNLPTVKEFNQALQANLLENEALKPNLYRCLWYPFLNSTNEVRLSLRLRCCDVKELKHVYTLYHNIQETLYWLDLFCLVGKVLRVYPADNRSQSFTLIRSCIKSIFHENLQRAPLLLLPDHSS